MFVVTLNKTSLKKVGAGALCCALVIFSAFLGGTAAPARWRQRPG